MMLQFLLKVLIGAAGLWVADRFVHGVDVEGWQALVIAALALGLVNAFVRPVVTLLTLPITFITLGLFLLVVNAAMIGLVAYFMDDFQVTGLIPGVMAAIVTGVVSWVGQMILGDGRRER